MDEEEIQKLEKAIKDLSERTEENSVKIDGIIAAPPISDHFHNGFDTSQIAFSNTTQRKVWVHHTIVGTAAATATNYTTFFIVPFTCTLTAFKEVHEVKGTNGSAVTVTLEKLTGTQAPDSGVVMLATALSLKATINTVQSGTLTATLTNRNLAIGDRLCLKDAGTLTDVANVSIICELQIK